MIGMTEETVDVDKIAEVIAENSVETIVEMIAEIETEKTEMGTTANTDRLVVQKVMNMVVIDCDGLCLVWFWC
jgi:hypothetical protein